jgi:16S rRNA (guanine(966)-N(2))-methyltransferase RsmD
MRIISGSKRGMNLLSPKTPGTRPITDRVKESVFNILYTRYGGCEGTCVADLFCGTGSLGMEALSRGAERVVFFEGDGRVVEILQKNIEKGGFRDKSTVRRANAFRFGFASVPQARKFDIVFVDPPYKQSEDRAMDSQLGKLLQGLAGQITEESVVLVRTHERVVLLEEYGKLKVADRREWGTQAVTFLQLPQIKESEGSSDV